MSANPYQATHSVTEERSGLVAKGTAFAILSGVMSAAAIGILFWGLQIYTLISLLSMRFSFHVYLSNVKIATLPFAFVPFLLAFGIHKKSRLCALVPALFYPGFMIWALRYGGASEEWDWTLSIPILIILASWVGLAGTILHHRSDDTSKYPT